MDFPPVSSIPVLLKIWDALLKVIQVKVIYSLFRSTSSLRFVKPPESNEMFFKYFMESEVSNMLAPGVLSLWDLTISGVAYR